MARILKVVSFTFYKMNVPTYYSELSQLSKKNNKKVILHVLPGI